MVEEATLPVSGATVGLSVQWRRPVTSDWRLRMMASGPSGLGLDHVQPRVMEARPRDTGLVTMRNCVLTPPRHRPGHATSTGVDL